MSARKTTKIVAFITTYLATLSLAVAAPIVLTEESIADELGWVSSPVNNCGGYYLEPAFTYPLAVEKQNSVEITSNQTLFAQHGTSILEGGVTVSRAGQQITTNKAYLYTNTSTGKLSSMEMIGNVHLREPNTLIIAKQGRYNFESKYKSLNAVLYRTALSGKQIAGPKVNPGELRSERKIAGLTAWGSADTLYQAEPRIYELSGASFSTCPPTAPTWQVKASHIVLNKNTGRGYATNARILVKKVPIFYVPYLSFSIDKQRKSGFLWPTIGVVSNKWGPYVLAPFYWNLAPNYDMTITPGLLTKRGIQLSDSFRYLTDTSYGRINVSVLPSDRFFADFQTATKENPQYALSTNPVTQAELSRLANTSTTRKALFWRNDSQYNAHWSSRVDYNYAGDDYYLRDFGSNLNEITENQLLQLGDLYYKSQNWNFTGRIQAYQTLHPIDEPPVQNQYRRFPQLILNGNYPNQFLGMEYFINNEVTHFDIRNTPGTTANLPIGNRFHMQPGVSLPLSWSSFYVSPRLQLALTDYNLYQINPTNAPSNKRRGLPIFDVASGLMLDRDTALFNHPFQQTLEPQIYYTYIPYRNQASIPIFDTTVNTLVYDQIFNYNRFSGLDRIGDANQLAAGVTTRFIDQVTGLEKVRLGAGEIIYFSNRKVTLCNSLASGCTDYPGNPNNHYGLSPLSGILDYHVNDLWKFSVNTIWNPITKQVDNSRLGLHYQPDDLRILNLGYSFVRNGDYFSGIVINNSQNNLKLTDVSFTWPVLHDISAMGRWSQDWHTNHFQNMLYGLQYDTCCWAVRMVGGKAFTHLAPNNTPQYNSEFYIQFALKGLGNVGNGNPSGLLSNISGYRPQFGQEF